MVTGRTRLFLASGAMAALGLLANACGTTSESSTTTSTIADPPGVDVTVHPGNNHQH